MRLLEATLARIGETKADEGIAARRRLDSLTKPQGSLGRLEDLAVQIVRITGNTRPTLKNKVIITMAGDHGVTEEGVSAYPKEVTPQMVYNFLRGGAAINVLARQAGSRVVVVDMGVAAKLDVSSIGPRDASAEFRDCKIGFGTKNFTKGPAMTREEAVASIEKGIEIVNDEAKRGMDILGTGDMGIGNTTPSAAVMSVITHIPPAEMAGYGTGITDEALAKKIAVIEKGIALNQPAWGDPIDVLAKVGGYEIGGICGMVLGAAANRVPVIIDGFISCAGAMLAESFTRRLPLLQGCMVRDCMIASHSSAEKGHRRCLQSMRLQPLLHLNLRLGEGTGAALAMHLAEASVRIMNEMATFESAGVSGKEQN